MHASREVLAGGGVFLAFFGVAVAFGATSGVPGLRVYSFLFGLGGGGACGIFAALMAHLSRGPAHYEPISDETGAWGEDEWESREKR